MHTEAKQIRQVWGAGRWFPGGREELQAAVNGYMDAASPPAVSGRIVAAIAPHAGYPYSGPVAGYTFRALRDAESRPATVVVLGFSHRGGFPGVALLDGDVLRTPLGDAVLDVDAARVLAAGSDRIVEDARPHRGEHSAENQVPFVQAALPDARLVVGLIGDHRDETLDELVAGLRKLAERKPIMVLASTDLLHDPDYELVSRTDRKTLELIANLDDAALLRQWDYGNQICCGIGPVVAAIRFAKTRGEADGTLLHYRNSGDDHPESRGNWVVGYGAVVFAVSD